MPKIQQTSFIETNPLVPTGPAAELFISGASIFEITDFEPALQRVSIVGINLPNPRVFGPYETYLATLLIPGPNGEAPEELTSFLLQPTIDELAWVGTTFLDFGGTLFPIDAIVQPISEDRTGPAILEGPVLTIENGEDGNGDTV